MSWKKYFKPVNSVLPAQNRTNSGSSGGYTAVDKFSTWLPEVYIGPPNRLQRYIQYEQMDLDQEVHAALDTIAEFSTLADEKSGLPFEIRFNDEPSPTESKLLETSLKQWCHLNEFNKRIFNMFRSTLMYGDNIFIRDPETYKLFWVDPSTVEKVVVNESEGKKPEVYFIRDLDLNLQELTASNTQAKKNTGYNATNTVFPQAQGGGGNAPHYGGFSGAGGDSETFPVDAAHIVHLSMTDGMNDAWPFGISILESIFKVYKQKELLEDSILIYRVHRAPERRVFFIDVGTMPPQKAQQYLERIKLEVQQKRIPSRSGGGANITDSSYNPMSMLEDYYFAQTCIKLDTKIPLLDGRELTLSEIIEEYEEGKENYVYSQDKDFGLEAGKIAWAGVTRKNAQLVRVTLDNDEYIDVTPDHRFIMRNGAEVEAQHLVAGESLMPLYLKEGKTSPKQKGKPYLRYIDNADGKTKWVHTTICGKTVTGKDTEIHHIDINSRNNNPTNLVEMDTIAHRELHRERASDHITSRWNDGQAREKLINGMRNFHDNISEEDALKMAERNRNNALKAHENVQYSNNVKSKLKVVQGRVAKQRRIQYSLGMFERVDQLFDEGNQSVLKICKVLRDDPIFQEEYRLANPSILREKGQDSFRPTDTSLNRLVQVKGYAMWGDYKIEKTGLSRYSNTFNHKVKSIEWLSERADTGDITVESESNNHIFAVSAGVYIHNSDGRGSKVETLPGGDNLGEIDDLRYFNNKMFRGLGVPSSYLPTGPDDGSATMNDGRVGTAFVQEHRFSKTCERHQMKIIENLDLEFKLFLKHRGINIDNALFNISFTTPQNFSEYREIEKDTAQLSVYAQAADIPFISKRYALKRYLKWSEDEILENERMWKEENGDAPEPTEDEQVGMGQAGISSGDLAPEDLDGFDMEDEEPEIDDTELTDDDIEGFGDET